MTNNDSIQFSSHHMSFSIAIFPKKHISCFQHLTLNPFQHTNLSQLYLPIIFNSTKRIGGYETSVNAEANQKPMSLPPTFSASGPTYHA